MEKNVPHSPPEPPAGRGRVFGFSAAGAVLGAAFGGEAWGLLSGAGLGWLVAETRSLRDELEAARTTRPPAAALPVPDSAAVPGAHPLPDSAPAPGSAPVRDSAPAPGSAPVRDSAPAPGSAPVRDSAPAPGSAPVPSSSPTPGSASVPSSPPASPTPSSSALSESASGPDRSRIQEAPSQSTASRKRPPLSGELGSREIGGGPSATEAASGRRFGAGLAARISGLLFGGNAVVRAGLLVLFVGLTLLVKYAVDHAYFPVEARLAAAAAAGLFMVGFGVRQRTARPGFAHSLQGGGFAILYLVTFTAFRVYHFFDERTAFALFAAIAASAATVAAWQGAQALLVIGSLGGFAAPILASTGEGNHVLLFSYDLLLTVSIAAVAWRHAWRWPAWVAFVSVYVVAAIWGGVSYTPEKFDSTEPFLLAFLFVFTATAVVNTRRRPPELRGLIDGTLVFGTPFVSILMQAGLVEHLDKGLAWSAAGFALFYALWVVGLQRFGPPQMQTLAEAFMALAIGFATMAIPFALEDGMTTATAWALEGAGLYWLGVRQDRRLSRIAGLLLQGLAGLACFIGLAFDPLEIEGARPIVNGRAFSLIAMTLAGLAMAFWAARRADRAAAEPVSQEVYRGQSRPMDLGLAGALGLWSLGWWTIGAANEIHDFVSPDFRLAAAVALAALSAWMLEGAGTALRWTLGRRLALLALPVVALCLLGGQFDHPQLLADLGWAAWPFALGSLVWIGARQWAPSSPDTSAVETEIETVTEAKGDRPSDVLTLYRAGCFWLFSLFLAFAGQGLAAEAPLLGHDWPGAVFVLGLAAALLVGHGLCGRGWVDRLSGLGPVAVFAVLAALGLQFEATGDALPLPHYPVFNPVDLGVAALGFVGAVAGRGQLARLPEEWARRGRAMLGVLACASVFIAINGSIARAVHQYTGVALDIDRLWDSSAFHMSISIVWTVLGVSAMWWASRRGGRSIWMASAALLAVVVLKLFVVDLAQLSTITRIATFLAVGLLLLVLGYLSPVPPEDEPAPEPAPVPESGEPER